MTLAGWPGSIPAARAQATFAGSGVGLGGNHTQAYALSGDGTVVVGYSFPISGPQHAFRWIVGGSMQDLGVLPGGDQSEARSANLDGSVVVGWSSSSLGPRAFRWTASGGMQDLGVPPGSYHGIGMGVSADGLVIAAACDSPGVTGYSGFRWSAAAGWQSLALQDPSGSNVYALSGNGAVIAGQNLLASNWTRRAFRWTEAGGLTDLGVLPGASEAGGRAVSGDGAVVVGWSIWADLSARAFRWTAATGMMDLGTPPGMSSMATAVNVDGSVVVGTFLSSTPQRIWIWTPAMGVTDLRAYLTRLGLDLQGWTLNSATGISADGLTIAGSGVHAGGVQSWVAHLPMRPCYANCDLSTTPPYLSVSDFGCFLNLFAAADAYANCDQSITPPVLNINDFVCFLNRFAAGCSG